MQPVPEITGSATSAGSSLTINWSSLQTSWYMVVAIAVDQTNATWSATPSGWTELYNVSEASSNLTLFVYGRFAPSASGSAQWTRGSDKSMSAVWAAFSSTHASSPVDVVGNSQTSTSQASPGNNKSISGGANYANGLQLNIHAIRRNANIDFDPFACDDVVINTVSETSGTPGTAVVIAQRSGAPPVGSATGDASATWTGGTSSYNSLQLILRADPTTTAWKDAATRFRLQAQRWKDAATRFRLQAAAWKDAPSRFKLQVARVADSTVRFRTDVLRYRDLATRFRLGLPAFKDAPVRFKTLGQVWRDAGMRFHTHGVAFKDAPVRFKTYGANTRDALARFKLQILNQQWKDAPVRFRSAIQHWKDSPVRFKLAILFQGVFDAPARFNLRAGAWKDAPARFRSSALVVRDAATRFRSSITGWADSPTRFRLTASFWGDAACRFNILARNWRDAACRFNIGFIGRRDAPVRFNLGVSATYRKRAVSYAADADPLVSG